MQALERPIYFLKKMEFSSCIKPTTATFFIEVLKQPLQVQTTNTTKSSTKP